MGRRIFAAHRIAARQLPDRDPFLLPLAAMLSGWGLLTVWRLEPGLGLRQALWLAVSLAAFIGLSFAPKKLGYLRRYKYLLLGGGLALTALTLLLGTNPAGFGPRLWLGCCGFYLQPSEPLKLLLVVYLSAYLADRLPLRLRFFPMLAPTIFVTGLALLLLVVQRDLGTASIFILLYTAVLFLATDRRRVLVATAVALLLAGLTGFFFVDVIHARLEVLDQSMERPKRAILPGNPIANSHREWRHCGTWSWNRESDTGSSGTLGLHLFGNRRGNGPSRQPGSAGNIRVAAFARPAGIDARAG